MYSRNLRIFVFALLIPVFFTACKKKKQEVIKMEYPIIFTDKMQIDTENVDSFVTRETFPFPTSLEGELSKKNTSKSKIRTANLQFLRLQILDYAYQDTQNYCNLQDISDIILSVKADGLGTREVAFKAIPDVRTNAINLDIHSVELKEYLQRDFFSMVISYKKRRAMHHEMPFVISTKFYIEADPL